MKTPILIIASFMSLGLCAQDFKTEMESAAKTKWIYLKLNPLPILQGTVPYTSEYRLGTELIGSPKVSYQLQGSYVTKSPLFNLVVNSLIPGAASAIRFNGFRFQGQVRYYLKPPKVLKDPSTMMIPEGFYTAIHGSYASADLRMRNTNYPRVEFRQAFACALIGYQAMSNQFLGIDMFLGVGVKHNTIRDVASSSSPPGNNTASDVGLFYASPFKLMMGLNLVFGLI
ncbi:MAG: hypothetical protein Kow0075_09060 [Salibacteraceae bacterium]